jgi:hypothetical protein
MQLPLIYLFEKGKIYAQFSGQDILAVQKLIKKAVEALKTTQ